MIEESARGGPRLLEVQHVAHRLSASQEYVRRLIRERKLPAIRLGTRWRIDPTDLQSFLDAQRTSEDETPCARVHTLQTKGA